MEVLVGRGSWFQSYITTEESQKSIMQLVPGFHYER